MIVCNHCNSMNNATRVTCIRCKAPLDDSISESSNVRQSPLRVVGGKKPQFNVQNPVEQPNIDKRHGGEQYPFNQPNAAEDSTMGGFDSGGVDVDSKGKRNFVLAVVGITLLACMGFVWYITDQNNQQMSRDAFAKAEDLFTQAKYSDALNAYEAFIVEYPQSELVPLADIKRAEIRGSLLAVEQEREAQQKRLPGLVDNAISAFQDKKYLTPEDDNAMIYIREILKIDPENKYINNMKSKIVSFYLGEAQKDVKRYRYRSATKNYERVLSIDPLNITAIEELGKIKARR